MEKSFKYNYPQTMCKITKTGIKAFEDYLVVPQILVNSMKLVDLYEDIRF